MLHINGKEVTNIYYGNKPIAAIYYGTQLVWQAIRSCFGTGIWVSKKPWLHKDKWKNKK